MSNLMSNYSPLDVTFTNGSGCWLTDSEGKKYFDALSGIGVVNLGHCHPAITQSIIEQSQAAFAYLKRLPNRKPRKIS